MNDYTLNAKKELRTEILIQASSQRVWDILTNFEKYPEWNPFIKSIKGTAQVGQKITARIEPPKASGMTLTPTDWCLKKAKNLDGKGIWELKDCLMVNTFSN